VGATHAILASTIPRFPPLTNRIRRPHTTRGRACLAVEGFVASMVVLGFLIVHGTVVQTLPVPRFRVGATRSREDPGAAWDAFRASWSHQDLSQPLLGLLAAARSQRADSETGQTASVT
jgi:hypothetical protein